MEEQLASLQALLQPPRPSVVLVVVSGGAGGGSVALLCVSAGGFWWLFLVGVLSGWAVMLAAVGLVVGDT